MSLSEALHDLSTAVAKTDEGPAAKAILKAKMDEIASRYREGKESRQQAFTRIFTRDAVGVGILKRYNGLTGPGYFEPQRQA
jgi:hypothetical protein